MPEPERTSFSAHIFVWLLAPAVEIYLALAGVYHHAPWQYLIEVLGFGVLGLAHWRWARAHWLGTLLCPGLIILLVNISLRAPPDLTGRFFYAAGLALLTTSILRDSQERLRVGAIAGALFVLFANLAWPQTEPNRKVAQSALTIAEIRLSVVEFNLADVRRAIQF